MTLELAIRRRVIQAADLELIRQLIVAEGMRGRSHPSNRLGLLSALLLPKEVWGAFILRFSRLMKLGVVVNCLTALLSMQNFIATWSGRANILAGLFVATWVSMAKRDQLVVQQGETEILVRFPCATMHIRRDANLCSRSAVK